MVIPSLTEFVGLDLPEDAHNCPFRLVSEYLKRSTHLRAGKELLLLTAKISSWIKATITRAYQSFNDRAPGSESLQGQVRAQDVRGLTSSWAAKGCISLDQIMQA